MDTWNKAVKRALLAELAELRGRVAAAERNAAQTASALVCVGHDYMRQSHLDGCETCRHLNRALAPAPARAPGGGDGAK